MTWNLDPKNCGKLSKKLPWPHDIKCNHWRDYHIQLHITEKSNIGWNNEIKFDAKCFHDERFYAEFLKSDITQQWGMSTVQETAHRAKAAPTPPPDTRLLPPLSFPSLTSWETLTASWFCSGQRDSVFSLIWRHSHNREGVNTEKISAFNTFLWTCKDLDQEPQQSSSRWANILQCFS